MNNNQKLKSIGLGIIILSLVALIVFTPKLMENMSCLKELMNDTTNIVLLCLLTLCITLIDPLMGLMFALCVSIVAVYLKDVDTNTLKEVETFMIEHQNPRTISQSLPKDEIKNNEMRYVENMMNYGRKYNMSNRINKENFETVEDLEVVEEETVNMSDNKVNQNAVDAMLQKKEEDKTNYLVNDKGVPCGNTHNFLTQVGPNDPAGFDIVGCRYDMKSSPQNNSIYGPPLAWCNTYDKSKMDKCGSLFYPLNG